MQIQLVWPKCPLGMIDGEVSWRHTPRNSFWVIVSQNEAEKFIVPLLDQYNSKLWLENLPKETITIENHDIYMRDRNGNVCFLIADDLSSIMFIVPYYPYSSMWDKNPFIYFEKNISCLEDLKNLL